MGLFRFFSSNKKSLSEQDLNFKKKLEKRFQIQVANPTFYREAFTHRSSRIKDSEGNSVNFERLEFLGDAVLGAVVAEHLFAMAPGKPEGYLTKMRSKIVSRKQLNTIGKELQLTEWVSISKDNALSDHIDGDLFEALIGAIYLDSGMPAASAFIQRTLIAPFGGLQELEQKIISHKSLMLEWAQKTKDKITFNTFEEQNAEEITVFVSILRRNAEVIAKGRGTSKKRAEEVAAKRAYFRFKNKIEEKA